MHKREIMRLFARIKQDGYSLIPLSVYFQGSRVKLELGLAQGKKLYDKRDSAAARDAKREMDRAMKAETDDPLREDKKGYDPSGQSHHDH